MVVHIANHLGGCPALNIELAAEYKWVEGAPPDTSPKDKHANGFSGDWSTNIGAVSLTGDGSHLSGTYATDNGRLDGNLENGVLAGIWAEDGSDHPCTTAKLGSTSWGRFVWKLSEDGKSFAGTWSYCDDDPSSQAGGQWTGNR